MYPKIKKYKQQDIFNDNPFVMPEKGRRFYVSSVLMLANWGRIYGVKDVFIRTKDNGLTWKVFVKFGNGRKWHTRSILNRGVNDTAFALYRYLFTLSEYDIRYLFNGEYEKILRDRFRRLKKLLKKSDIH